MDLKYSLTEQNQFKLLYSYSLFLLSGDYEVSMKFNNEHIPDSPFIVPVAKLSDDARRLTVTSLQVKITLQK